MYPTCKIGTGAAKEEEEDEEVAATHEAGVGKRVALVVDT